jgi:hypothetical protein
MLDVPITFRPRVQTTWSTPHIRRAIISGRLISKLGKRWRAEFALDLLAGKIDFKPTRSQLAGLVGCSVRTLDRARQRRERPHVIRNGRGR